MRRLLANFAMWLSDLGAALVAPFERLVGGGARRLFSAGEGLDRVEGLLLGLWRCVTWPVRMIGRGLAAVARLIVPESVAMGAGQRLDRWRAGLQRSGSAAWALLERLNLDAPMRWLAWLLQPLWRPLAAVGGFAYAWAVTRPYRQMAWGLPALTLLLPVLGTVAWAVTWGRDTVATRYRVAVREARHAQDFASMRLYEQKLEQLGVDTERNDFEAAKELADAADKLSGPARDAKLAEAYALMRELAPEDELGLPAAHFWILVRLLGGELDVADDERLRLAGVHLERLEKLGASGMEFDVLRAVYHERRGELEQAAEVLEPYINRMELAATRRMVIDIQLKRLDEARRDATALHQHLEQAERKGEAFDAPRYQAYAQAEELLGNGSEFARVARLWLKVAPEHPVARRSVLAVDRMEFAGMLQSDHASGAELARRLAEMMTLAEDHQQFEAQLTDLYARRARMRAVDEMFTLLADDEQTPVQLTAAIGALAAMHHDIPLARRQLARVVASDPQHAVAWNNYAWVLSREPEPDPNAALDAVNRALAIAPHEFRFRETRGQVLVQLGRWQEAVEDLEFALNGMPDARDVHLALATAYENLNDANLARIHRQQAGP
jgi:tetratricopeptide (TPR) repeat protein